MRFVGLNLQGDFILNIILVEKKCLFCVEVGGGSGIISTALRNFDQTLFQVNLNFHPRVTFALVHWT